MKLLILHNGKLWKSWDKKIQGLKDWWAPEINLDITLEQTKFKNIPWVNYGYPKPLQGIDQKWYDENISKPAKQRGFDCVILTLNEEDWPDKKVEGWHTNANLGIEEIQILGRENAKYNFNGVKYEGDYWFNVARHELAHALYAIRGKIDNTHFWWELGNLAYVKTEIFGNPIVNAVKSVISPPKKYKYFNQNEIEGLKPELVEMLDKARELSGTPYILTSTLRDTEKNAEVGGVNDSEHLTGNGVDVKCLDSATRWKIVKGAIEAGFNRIGIGEKFVHLGNGSNKPKNVMWTYYK